MGPGIQQEPFQKLRRSAPSLPSLLAAFPPTSPANGGFYMREQSCWSQDSRETCREHLP